MPNRRLQELMTEKQEFIFQQLIRLLDAPPRSRYQTFMKSPEGEKRIRQWLMNIREAVAGNREVFLSDASEVGYLRAHQGYRVDFIFRYYITYQSIIRELLEQDLARHPDDSLLLLKEYHELCHILTSALQLVTASYLKTREEIIVEKVTQLELLSDFTKEIISSFSIDKIAKYIQENLIEIFGAGESILVLQGDDTAQRIFTYPKGRRILEEILPVVKATRKAGVTLFMTDSGKITRNIFRSDIKRVVAVPIQAKHRRHGVFVFSDWKKGFCFTEKEHDFLLQFINVIVIAIENALMLEEIEKSRQDLRLLAGNIIHVEEERRKRLAGDIHDTLTQTLTAIGYKIQFCKELNKTNPDALQEQFDVLIETVHHAIDQSRHITTGLHPDLIVHLGLVPALKRHISCFENETGIRVRTDFSTDIRLPYEVNICLFRMVQEALTNVFKHAGTDEAEITLQRQGEKIHLTISDKGGGIKRSELKPELKNGKKMGLMILKERVESVGGTFSIRTAIGKGCHLEAEIDIKTEGIRNENDSSDDCR